MIHRRFFSVSSPYLSEAKRILNQYVPKIHDKAKKLGVSSGELIKNTVGTGTSSQVDLRRTRNVEKQVNQYNWRKRQNASSTVYQSGPSFSGAWKSKGRARGLLKDDE